MLNESLHRIAQKAGSGELCVRIMKKIIKSILAISIGLFVILFLVNYFVRVSDGYKSYGYMEDLLFDRPIKETFDKIFFSKNYLLWNDVNERAFRVGDLLMKYGKNIVDDRQLDNKRIEAMNSLETALQKCELIQDEYIKNSNPELLVKYRSHFQSALRLWHEGLQNKDSETMLKGIREYNIFLTWMQSSDRNVFKNMK